MTGTNTDSDTEIEPDEYYIGVRYAAHVQNIGWQNEVSDGTTSGTTGRGLQIEAINIVLDNSTSYSGGISYASHIKNIGWQNEVSGGNISGTVGRNLQIEAIKMNLTGELSEHFDIYYRTHIADVGWMPWTKNGQISGSTGISYRVEALRINLVRKGAPAPGSVANYYKNKPVYTPKPAALDVMSKNAQVRASSTRWLIMTDTSACQVGVYSGSYGYGRGKSFGSRSYTCWYYTQFHGNYLFHSVLYNRGSMTQIKDGTLGKQVSHGCVRLDINNAKWLYDNIPNGTKVVIY